MSMSSETVYYDADEQMSEDGRLNRNNSCYQDGIDEYPASTTGSLTGSPRSYRDPLQMDEESSEEALEQDQSPINCLSGFALPWAFSGGNDSARPHKLARLTRPPAGSSIGESVVLPPQPESQRASDPAGSPAPGASLQATASGLHPVPVKQWQDPGGSVFMVRTRDYNKTKKKEPSGPSIYKLLAVDLYSFEFKLSHIAKHVQLPTPPPLGDLSSLPAKERLPPLLVINIQLPDYPPSLFAKGDGQGCSLVYYFGLPDGWTPEFESNKAALGLAQRLIHGGTEADNTPTRDRLKLMPRIANVDEWAVTGPLSSTEQALLRRYNDKPLMTRPQHKFYTGSNYFEIDLDVHNYAYLARKAFTGFTSRLDSVIFDNAFIIQGNRPEELPELVLGAARMSYVNFGDVRPFPERPLDSRRDDD